MKFVSKKPKESLVSLARMLGYQIIKIDPENESNLVRPLGPDGYPRFHLYLKTEGENLVFSLHLDQKKPSYQGQTAHSGEYDDKLVEAEKQRIDGILGKMGQ
jgi:hypothetical protein